MAPNKTKLSDFIGIRQRFQRSVSLEKDYSGRPEVDEYIVTPTAREAARRILEGLEEGGACRALTLTGPYGVGKSAFALFLTRLFCAEMTTRVAVLDGMRNADPGLAQVLSESRVFEGGGRQFLPVLITARRIAATLCIVQGLAESLESQSNRKLRGSGGRLAKMAEELEADQAVDTRRIVTELESTARVAVEAGYAGILLVIDELGKLFEYAARDPRRGDPYILQEIAEAAARSEATPILAVGLLHQSFEEYGKHLDLATRREWTKIQGRFTDLAFQEPPEQTVRLIASAIQCKKELPAALTKKLRRLASRALRTGVNPPLLGKAEFEDIARQCYPLHPSTLVALPILFNRFAQNERSLFSYLSSMEPGGFQEFVRTQALDPRTPPFIRLPDLFDYFTRNFGAGLYRQPHARRWLEAADAIDREAGLDDSHRGLVKTIGVLSVLGEFSHLRASERGVAFALEDGDSFSFRLSSGVAHLREKSLLTYRKFNDTYRIWEGSDIDIEERIAEGSRKVERLGLANIVQRYLVTRPLVARRHSFETGTLRYFELIYVDQPDDIAVPADESRNGAAANGRIVVCLFESTPDAQTFEKRAKDLTDRPDVLFAIPQDTGGLRSTALELAALRWAWENTPELRDDRVARREIALRLTGTEHILLRNLSRLLDPRQEPVGCLCRWYWNGKEQKVGNPAGISQLLSTACDTLYAQSPRIHNELVVRRSLSSAASSARRKLIEAMLQHGDEPRLGIQGFPPERSIYESVLTATGLHRCGDNGRWRFACPNDDATHNLLPAWRHLEATVFGRQGDPVPVPQLSAKLAAPPYGIPDGLQAILICSFMMVHRDEATLYREGTFIPEYGTGDFELLIRRPEFFAMAGCRVVGERAKVVDRLARGLQIENRTVPVVKELFRRVKQLPEFARKTQNLPNSTLALRNAFEDAKGPELFLFSEVPGALGLPPFVGSDQGEGAIEAFFSALNRNLGTWSKAAPVAQAKARDMLLSACGLEPGESGWQKLRQESIRLETYVTSPQLLDFVRRVAQSSGDQAGVNSVLGLVSDRPPDDWSDIDIERFPDVAEVLGRAFTEARRRATETSGVRGLGRLPVGERPKAEALMDAVRAGLLRNRRARAPALVVRAALEELANEFSDESRYQDK
ncbi:MAG: DUF2791 family P-loop domain-containing protein [Lentisphaerae bacterium]|jgi:hypothetical protein|nr:DUF2791 family P-loop domain-containing protein [Lentisphaerota bacterium]